MSSRQVTPLAKPEIRILASAADLVHAAAEEFMRQAGEVVRASGLASVALSGGSTPQALYRLLANEADATFRRLVPWERIHFFWGDERHVPPDHPDSNYRMAHEAMLSRVPVPPQYVHRIRAENPDAGRGADAYAEDLRQFLRPAGGQFPRFDLILLGMGPDGHTASLFPGTDAVREEEKLVVAPWVEKLGTYRITLTPPVLNNAACVVFLISGAEKADTLRDVLQGDYRPDRLPAQLVRPSNGRLVWLVDRAAARLLAPPSPALPFMP